MPTATRRAGVTLGLILLAALLGPTAPAARAAPAEGPSLVEQDDPLFGVNFIPPEEPLMSMAWDAGARVARIQINWQDVEYTHGEYYWDYVDSLVNPLVDKGFIVHAVLTLPPPWRRESGDGLMPADINRPWDHRKNRWAHWVGAVAHHYRGRVESYEIWNEPDLDQYWNGSPGQYVDLLRSAYPAIKANDPDATVVMAGMAIFIDRGFMPEVIQTLATLPNGAENDYFFDVMSIHIYSDPDTLYEELADVRALLDRYGMDDKPIWLTETGVPIWNAEGPPNETLGFGNEEEAGWFILQGFANALAIGVERIIVYRLHDDVEEQVLYGMLRGDNSERPAYDAFRVATRYLGGKSDVTRRVSNGSTIVNFNKPDGTRTIVVWANDGGTTHAQVPANHGNATLIDWQGNSSRIQSSGGVYNLPLRPATNARIGGPASIILEEQDGSPPLVEVSWLPDTIPAGTELALSWSGDDGRYGTGVVGYDVQVSHDDGPWFSWMSNTTRLEAIYDVSAGGNFKFRVRARDRAGNVSEYALANPFGTWTPGAAPGETTGAIVTTLPPIEGEGDPYFGVNFVPPESPWIDLAWDAGVRSARVQVNWQDIERNPGLRDWAYPDSQVMPLVDYGYEVTVILTLPPEFRRASPDGLMPADLYLVWNHPDNAWGNIVHEIAQRYEGKVSAYEIWNEPDLYSSWNGSPADYGELLRSAYRAIKAVDPDTPVVIGGLALRGNVNFLPDVIDYVYNDEQGPGNDFFFDAVGIHIYSDTDRIYDELISTRQLLDSYGMTDKTIWLTETNVPLWGEASGPTAWESGYADPEEAGWFIVQAFATALAGDAERVMVYRFHDVGEPIAHGLLRNDQSRRPTYTAFQTTATFMADVVSATREQESGATIVRLEKANGGRVTVLWANTGAGATVDLEASRPAGVFANADGAVWPADPDEDGEYVIDLDPATNRNAFYTDAYFFGGPPVLLVEDDVSPPTVVIDPLPVVPVGDVLFVSWSADDGVRGTGVTSYDVEVRTDEGSWTPWLEETTDTVAEFDTSVGGTFRFRVRARDRAGNVSEFVENAEGQIFAHGVLLAQVLNVRGEPVPNARVTLTDGRKYTGGSDGVVQLTDLEEGRVDVERVDGGAQGEFFPAPITTVLGEEMRVTWTLLPKNNRVPNGTFDGGLEDWHSTPTAENDVSIVNSDGNLVLQIAGQRRPWGLPAASVSFKVPRGLSSPVLSFNYALPTEGQTLVLAAIVKGGRDEPDVLSRVWQSDGPTEDWQRIWLDATPYLGEQVEFIFTLEGPKGAAPGLAQIDDVVLGSVPTP